MPIIFFVGQGVTPKAVNYEYEDGKYIKNDFVESLKKLDQVIIPDISYHHIYYYQKTDIAGWKDRYDPIGGIDINDIYITNFIENLKFDTKQKYILMGHSAGIYFAMEFARQYPNQVKHIISLDGSWISTKLCKQRLTNWKNKGKKVKLIESQHELDELVNKAKSEDDNDKYITLIFDHSRLEHTNECIKHNYETIIKQINYTVFRDFNSNVDNDMDKQFNEYAVQEHNILSNLSDKYRIHWLVNATHNIYFNELYKKQILEQIELIINQKGQMGGNNYYFKYAKYKNKYLSTKCNRYNKQIGGGNIIIHIAGSQGSGKTTLGNKLSNHYGNKITVFDLDDLQMEYEKNKDKSNYQSFLNNIIKTHNSKPLIFVGLDAELCLGLMEDSDVVYDLQADHKFYIKSSNTLKQRFYRQIDKLEKRKEWFFEEWLINPQKIQEKIFRFVDLNKWKENNEKCDELYIKRDYEFLDSETIFNNVRKILDKK